jgi:hypothetical protein
LLVRPAWFAVNSLYYTGLLRIVRMLMP